MDCGALGELLAHQYGVISRRQLLDLGCRPHDIARLTRRRELTSLHPGVYVEHTGPPAWPQRAWASVLALWPAALCDESALRAETALHAEDDGRAQDAVIHVAVALGRHPHAPPGVRVHRRARLDGRVLWHLSPPRVRYEEAALDVATRARSDFAALAVLTEACRTRRTSPERLAATLAQRSRSPRRAWVSAVLTDLAAGTASVLERRYLNAVERAQGLPRAERQARATASVGVVYRDVEYAAGLVVELDGRLVHNTVPQRDADFERDLDAAVDGRTTVRLSWGQVVDRPCATALKIAALLRHRGWSGAPRPCSPDCPVDAGRWWIRCTG